MANFNFVIDGATDMMSLNPLEMTNFEMMGTIFGIGGILFTLLLSRIGARRQPTHEFEARETADDAIDQYP